MLTTVYVNEDWRKLYFAAPVKFRDLFYVVSFDIGVKIGLSRAGARLFGALREPSNFRPAPQAPTGHTVDFTTHTSTICIRYQVLLAAYSYYKPRTRTRTRTRTHIYSFLLVFSFSFQTIIIYYYILRQKVKQSRYTPWRRLGWEEV
jgi:hypothetical protein